MQILGSPISRNQMIKALDNNKPLTQADVKTRYSFKKFATGTFSFTAGSKTISALGFNPTLVVYYTFYDVGGVWTNQGFLIKNQEMAFYSSGNMFSGRAVSVLSQSGGNSAGHNQSDNLAAGSFTLYPQNSGGTQTIKWFAFE